MDGTVRFASAADRAAFTAELMQAVTSLVAKYHDERAEGGREHHLVVAVHPSVPAGPGRHRQEARILMGHPVRAAPGGRSPGQPGGGLGRDRDRPGHRLRGSWAATRSSREPAAPSAPRSASTRPSSPITGWDPARRFGYGSGQAPDGRFIAYEFLIEGRAGSSTVLRAVTSGFLPGDDWAEEFEAMTLGGELHFATLVEYLTHFAGRFAVPVTAFGPPGTGWSRDRPLLVPRARPGRPARGRRPGAVRR